MLHFYILHTYYTFTYLAVLFNKKEPLQNCHQLLQALVELPDPDVTLKRPSPRDLCDSMKLQKKEKGGSSAFRKTRHGEKNLQTCGFILSKTMKNHRTFHWDETS